MTKKYVLRPFQKDGVDRMVHFLRTNPAHGVFNASEMGCGKTPMAIATCNVMNFKRILVICPAVMRLVWADEIKRWSKHDSPRITIISKSSQCNLVRYGSERSVPTSRTDRSGPLDNLEQSCVFVITSYQLARTTRVSNALQNGLFDCLICDESHALKSTKSLQTEHVLRRIWPKIPYRICLSGTPFTQSIMDCYTTFSRMAPSYFPDYFKFADTYAEQEQTPYGVKYYGLKNSTHLRKIIRENFFIRYEKKDVLPELPDKQWTKITLPTTYKYNIPPELKPAYEEYLSLLKGYYSRKENQRRPPPQPPMHFMTVRRHQGMHKIDAIYEFAKNLIDQNIPTVIFGYHVEFIETLAKKFKDEKPSVITGSTLQDKRAVEIRRYMDGHTSLFIGQYAACGVGINLTRGANCILGELDYSPAVINQAIDRLHRIGQENSVNVYYFVVEDTLEEEIVKIVMEKAAVFKEVLS